MIMAEVLIANLIFLMHCPKRKQFTWRIIAVFIISITIAFFGDITLIPVESDIVFKLLQFAQFMLYFFIGYFGMLFCFNIAPDTCFALCSAGYACQHIGSRIFIIGSTLMSEIFNIEATNNYYAVLPDDVDISKIFLHYYVYSLEFASTIICYEVLYIFFGKKVKDRNYFDDSSPLFNVLAIMMVLVSIGLNRLVDTTTFVGTIGVALYSIVCLLFALIIMFNLHQVVSLKSENSIMHSLFAERQKQYEISKSNIELINLKCHDLKHKLNAYSEILPKEELDELKKNIDIYDSSIKTGNNVLDTILTEKNLLCSVYGISLTCLGNGKLLSFLSTVDIYSLFGNIIDNAIDAVKNMKEEGKKIISINFEGKGDYLIINTMNYYTGNLNMVDGVPETTKNYEQGYHGFGLKSIKRLSEKYDGNMVVSTDDGIFSLSISLNRKMVSLEKNNSEKAI